MPARSWKFHLSRIATAGAALAVLGWLVGHPVKILLASLVAYQGWHLFNIARLFGWLQDTRGPIPESRGIWADIFDSINAMEDQTRRQEDRYRNMITEFQNLTNALPDATLVIDSQGNITWSNDTATAMLGLRLPEDLGQSVTNLLRGPAFAEWLQREESKQTRLEMPSPVNDNQWLHVTSVPFQQHQRLIVLRDITEIHNVERIRRDFVANISHELRTPVTVLLGYLELLQNHPASEVADAITRMQGQTRQMKALLDDLLELSRLQSDEIQGEEQEVDVPAMLEQLKEQAIEISQGKHRLNFSITPGLRLVGVASDLESAFRNLIINAIRYTPEQGEVQVDWSDSPQGPRLAVRDTGIGIPKRDLPRLTERFYRVGSDRARQSGGTGLGLAIVKHVMNAHKARLLISSELGEGSQFACLFPPERKVSATAASAVTD